ncbi:hypothetical protein NJT12_15175 [Flavobacterium sp. AC]|uniref:Lipoprotein n=1 Tax=Flavobacterium azizsancarii TaxID=2961580 RepID=A0ABT4WES0_9FLAO|nr:hypothetical protein [Flavobacterium azizsancarii]MDA6070955.1 hypothetical protein [Flavobacterium azizsancarii]
MIKKFLLCAVVLSQFAISCSSDDNTDPTKDPTTEEPKEPVKDPTLAEQIAELVKKPYSTLTPAQQKLKLEAEANEMLVQLDKSKSSSALKAIENLHRLLVINPVDIFNGKNGNEIEDILNVSDVYGIYTWNNSGKIWAKTASTSELKFIFPAKESETSNSAILSAKSVSSTVKIKFTDTDGSYIYDEKTDNYIHKESIYDQIFLPSSADAVLTINNAQAAVFTQTASYSNGKEVPNEFAYKMTLNDGYAWEMSGKKGAENTSKAVFSYNGKILLDFNGGSNSNIDGLMGSEALIQYRGKANGLINLMDNFVIVADMDLATEAADKVALEKSLVRPTPLYDNNNPNNDYKAYHTALNVYEKKQSEGLAAISNKNLKLILVSKKDGTKIADIVQHSEKSGDDYIYRLPVWNAEYKYWTYSEKGEEFNQPYLEEVYYLKFNDNTEVAMSVYFSEGFEKLSTKFTDFAASFKK